MYNFDSHAKYFGAFRGPTIYEGEWDVFYASAVSRCIYETSIVHQFKMKDYLVKMEVHRNHCLFSKMNTYKEKPRIWPYFNSVSMVLPIF